MTHSHSRPTPQCPADATGGHAHEHGGCAHAADHAARAPAAIADAEALCAERGLRLTPIRRQVLEALYATHRPMSAYDLIDALEAGGGKRHAPVTIYRALDFLLEQAFAHRLESRNAFIACPFRHAPGDLVVFMICDRCGGVDEAVSDELRRDLAQLARRQGFTPHARVIELAGSCAHCRG
ncbi:transcriptional repressor [Alsobacter sp. SYSU M60028]|uniref:Transcriptional repressor n=1 Tax=Alsobacter ponti TaxID=2962936 RepID=A0ABT1LBP0_9HYPH|nr:transcriptional repressor [Alsobacter ponti]MCP8938905.1 transcriptional repressor [Alsobacter ponti]